MAMPASNTAVNAADSTPSVTSADAELDYAREISAREPRNTLVLELYQVVLRVGWIFKTESIIIPAVLDAINGAGWLRGCLPVINRFGQSVPPVLYSRHLGGRPHKKWSLLSTTLGMAVCFLLLALAWGLADDYRTAWMTAAFLVLYGIFSCINGLNQLAIGTLQGKLVGAAHRGRAMLISTAVGAALAILFAWWLMGPWLELANKSGFTWIFAFTGVAFVVAAGCAPLLDEPADQYQSLAVRTAGHFRDAWHTLQTDANFRRLALVSILFGVVLILFPHYQALGRDRLGLPLENLMLWVIVQNIGTGLFSMLAGPLADRRGTRLVLTGLIFATASTPLLAVLLGNLEPALGKKIYWLVFLPLGLTPIAWKTMTNYTLEICRPADHPRYLAALGLCLAVPFVFSPLVGWLIDLTSFEAVFVGGAVLILAGGVISLGLREPRHHVTGEFADLATPTG